MEAAGLTVWARAQHTPFLGPLHTDGKGKKHFGNLAYIFTDELAWQNLSMCLVTGVETKATFG